jgi:predicted NUDIX family phosphoesterase
MAIQSGAQKQTTPINLEHDELILVVKRKHLFAKQAAWSGLKKINADSYLELIKEKKEFQPRSVMETDPTYKQIIPYLVFTHNDRYFIMQRKSNASEKRLQNKFSLGIGGHIRQEDLTSDSIVDWAKREFHEEVSYTGAIKITPLGILNDDSNPVGQVHIGFVFLIEGEHDAISVKSELKSGQLLTVEECKSYFSDMESWSQIIFEFLLKEV